MKIKSIVQPISHPLGPHDSLSTVAKLLEAEEITALPVINHDGTLLGVITRQDVETAGADGDDSSEARAIAEFVRPGCVTCTLADEVAPLANQARSQNHTHAMVVDDLGNLVGIADLSPYQGSSQDVQHREEALDEALDETFPASDPISPP
ncbi:MAG TPA: CBS domain-containing protein [Halomonas sp.]|nr:CBS domain-containing protein [Halomonas sp.]